MPPCSSASQPGSEGAFGAFLMLGDPDLKTSAALLDAVVEGGADMVEVGIPFSDPVADGPVIQAAAQRALAAGVRVSDCLELIAGFRARHPDVPVGILTYANIVIARGGFMRDAAAGRRRQPADRRCALARGGALRTGDGAGGYRAGADRRREHARRDAARASPGCQKPTPIASAGPASPARMRAASSMRR